MSDKTSNRISNKISNSGTDKVTLILPVRKAGDAVKRCIMSILRGTVVPQILVIDCTAAPGALDALKRQFPQVRVIDLKMNPGRAHAVNTGIHLTRTPYVMTFSPRLIAGKHCVERLCEAMDRDDNLFSAQARILSAEDRTRISGAGWSIAPGMYPVKRGMGAKASSYAQRAGIAAAMMEAAIYRMEYLEVTGIFDERFYGRLEDLDLGVRGILAGFDSLYEPAAGALETEASEHSRFYEHLETGNRIYMRYKFGQDDRLQDLKAFFKAFFKASVAKLLPGAEAEEDPAVIRGRMLCFQAEMERMEREELDMSVTKQTLPEEFCLREGKDGPTGVYPLFLGERAELSLSDLPAALRLQALMAAGAGEKARVAARERRRKAAMP